MGEFFGYFRVEQKDYNFQGLEGWFEIGRKCGTIEAARKERKRVARYYGKSLTKLRIVEHTLDGKKIRT